MKAFCGKCGAELQTIGDRALTAGHDCVKKLVGARQIMIVITENGYTVQEGEYFADELCWDEMLGQIVSLTHPDLKRSARYRMMTAAQWVEWRNRMRAPIPDFEFKEVGE